MDRPFDRAEFEGRGLRDHSEVRDRLIQAQISRMGFRERRKARPDQMAAAYDLEHLEACRRCGILRRKGTGEGSYCRPCGGQFGPHPERPEVLHTAGKVEELRKLLARNVASDE